MPDLYSILNVPRSSSADELKSAYRKLAKKLHPDVNPGRKDIEQKFKEVTAAYDLLSDKDKRARYDRGEIDDQGQERGFGGGSPFGSRGAGGRHHSYTASGAPRGGGGDAGGDPFAQFGMEGMEDILSEFMGGGRGGKRGAGARQAPPTKGADIIYAVAVPFVEAAIGGKRRLNLSGGKTLDVMIPPGTSDGHKLRLRGQGETAPAGAGDAIIEIKVEPHAFFTRKENDIILDAPISLSEALAGASITVPTLNGSVTVKVPPNANTGTTLRLKGKGIPAATPAKAGDAGDMFVKLRIMLPDAPSEDLAELVEKWAKKHPYNPRAKLGWG